MGRDRDRSAIEPTARCVPAVSRARPTEPGESDALLCTQSGGLSPPPVLGAGAARTTSSRCTCPPLPPPALLTHPQPAALRARGCLTHAFARGTGRHDGASGSPRTPRTSSCADRAPLQHHPQVDGPSRPGLGVVTRSAIRSCRRVVARAHRRHRFCACGAANTHVHDCFKCCRCSAVLYQVV